MHRSSKPIGRWISILYRVELVSIADELEPLGIGRGQHTILAELFDHDGTSQKELTKILRMDKGAVAHALTKLEDSGYVSRVRDEVDSRVVRVHLTRKARMIENKLFTVISNWTDTILEGFSGEEREQVLGYLRRMAENAARVLELDVR